MKSILACATAVALFGLSSTAAFADPPPATKGPVDGFSPLHDTLNLDSKPYIALLIEVKGANASAASETEAKRQAALALATFMSTAKPDSKRAP